MNRSLCASIACIALAGVSVLAQEPSKVNPVPAAESVKAAPEGVPLRIELVLSRYTGDKKIASLPYTISAAAGQQTDLRVGAEVPYLTTPVKPLGDGAKLVELPQSHSYRTVGISIRCTPVVMPGDRFRLDLVISEDSIVYDDNDARRPKGVPIFRTFLTTNRLVLRDGQSGQITSAADPVTGEVLRVEATLTLLK